MIATPLTDALILLAAAVVAVPVAQRLHLGSVLGFLVAGAMVGPWGLGLITSSEEIRHLAEFGVVFLLFLIGIELKPARLWLMRRLVFGLGSAQVAVTGAVLGVLAWSWGVGVAASVLVGLGLALSSTAFVVQILAERNELLSQHGRPAFAVLLLQDLAVVPLLALVPLLAAGRAPISLDLGIALAETAAIVGVVLIAGRYLLRPLLAVVAGSRNAETFTALALLLVLGTAQAMAAAGLSMAMGAFIAGLLIADSEYRHQVMADILPFRGLLLGLFFMSVGMSIDFGHLRAEWMTVAGWLAMLIAAKVVLLWPMVRLTGLGARPAFAVALLLGQAGEFGFVLFSIAHQQGLFDAALFQRMIAVVALSMAVTPLLALVAHRQIQAARDVAPGDSVQTGDTVAVAPVVITGFGRVGQRIARLLAEAQVPYLAIERDAERVARGRLEGLQVFFGDAARGDVLRAAGIGQARLVLIAFDDAAATERAVAAVRRQAPAVPVVARAHDRHECERLLRIGATHAISETLESSLQLATIALTHLGQPREVVERLIEDSRRREERLDQGAATPPAR